MNPTPDRGERRPLKEAAERADKHINTLRTAIKRGDLRAMRPTPPNGALYVYDADLDAWLNTPAVPAVDDDGFPLDADGYAAPMSEEDRQRVMLADPNREPDFSFFRDRAEFLTPVGNPLTGGHITYSWAMKPIFERYISARLGGQSVAEARESSGYNKRIDPDEGWDL
jgi:hypothetical protein